MINTTLILIAGLILTAIFLTMFMYSFYLEKPNIPLEEPVEVTMSIDLTCTQDTMNLPGATVSIIKSIQSSMHMTIKNHEDGQISVNQIVPIVQNVSKNTINLYTSVLPNGYKVIDMPVEWGFNGLVMRVYPGDKITLKEGFLERDELGKVVDYISTLPNTPPPPNYISPFLGSENYTLQITGNNMTAEIKDPGYAAKTLLENYNYPSLLVLTSYKIGDYFYKEYDIPYYIDIYKDNTTRTGFYMYASGSTSLLGESNTVNITSNGEKYIGLWVGNGESELYTNDDTTPSLVSSAPSPSGSHIAFGIAREKKAESSLKLMLVFWNHEDTKFYIPGQWKGQETDYVYFVANPNNNQSYMKMWGPYKTTGTFDNPDTWGSPVIDPDGCKCGDPDWPPFIWIMQVNPPGPDSHDSNGTNHGNEVLDLIFGWDDTQGCCIEEKFRVTIFQDGWARVEHINVAGAPYDEVFIAPVNDYSPSNDNNGDGYPDNWYHIWSLTNQAGGVVWKDVSQYIHWEKHPVSTKVDYQGVFKGRTVTISGLYPGDRIVLSTPDKVRIVNVTSEKVTIDLLSMFGPEELIKALEQGGVVLAVQPTIEHIISLIPSKALVHVYGTNIDEWERVDVMLKPHCVPMMSVTYGTVKIERRGDLYSVILNPGTQSEFFFGTYPKIEVRNMYDFNIDIHYTSSNTRTIKPNDVVEFTTGTVEFYQPMNILLITSKPIYITPSGSKEDDNTFSYMTITGSFTIQGFLGK